MLYYTYIKEFDIKYLRATEPFSLGELYNLHAVLGPQVTAGPALFDLKAVKVENLEMPDIRRHLIKKGDLGPEITNVSCAYVVEGETASSIVNKSLQFSKETWGPNTPETLVTEEFTEAASWLGRLLGKNRFEVYRALDGALNPLGGLQLDS